MADVASPVLELTVIEVPEGRNVFELPSVAARSRPDDLELSGSEDLLDAMRGAEVTDEAPRKHRHHSSRIHSHEEQADEAVVVRNHHPRMATTPAPIGKHRSATHRPPRPTLSPVPTLATLEDHDLFRETEEEETARAEADEMRMMQRPVTSIFMQRLMQHHQQHHNPARPRGKDNRRMAYWTGQLEEVEEQNNKKREKQQQLFVIWMYRVKSLKNLKKKIYPRDVRYRGDCTVKHVIIYILYKEKERRKILSFPFSLSLFLLAVFTH